MRETRIEPGLPIAWLFVFVLAVVFPPLFLIVPIRAPGTLVLVSLLAVLGVFVRPATFSPVRALRGPPAARRRALR